jgi:hypothetical protein
VSLVAEARLDDGSGMNCSRFAAAGIAAMAIGCALPGIASANDYCVNASVPSCTESVATFDQALDKADNLDDVDRIFLGQGQYEPQAFTGFSYGRPTGPVEIIGAGQGQTLLTAAPGAAGNVLFLHGASGTSIRDLTVRIPAQVAPDFRGLTLWNAARRIDIVGDSNQSGSISGVLLVNGGSLNNSVVDLMSKNALGVKTLVSQAGAEPNAVRDSSINAEATAVLLKAGGTVERSVVTSQQVGVWAQGGTSSVESSVVRLTTSGGFAAYAAGDATGTTLRLNSDTILGSGGPTDTGVMANTGAAPAQDIHIDVANSIIDAHYALSSGATGPGKALFDTSHSAYDPTHDPPYDGITKITETALLNVSGFGFVHPAAGDLHLRPDSPLVDAGDPASPQGTDLDGNPLVADGDGDGVARRDIGAFEVQPAPAASPDPEPAADTLAPIITGFHAGRARLAYRLSESARVTVRIQRRLAGKRARYRSLGKLSASAAEGANRTPVSPRIRRKALRPGRYRAVITAIDAAGNRSAPKVAAFRVRR